VLQDLHHLLEWAQLQLMDVSSAIAADYFGGPKPAAV
jgi:hypothetical protein